LRLLAIVIVALLGYCPSFAAANTVSFDPATFQSPDGALTLNPGGNYVEPYFATKALIVAQDGGLDTRASAEAWIGWALPRQRPDGLFRRFCRGNGAKEMVTAEWRDCAPADADDSMLALWMQLLYRMSPDSGMPAEWQHSVALAGRQLAKLRNRRLGVYHISGRNHVALFMDNIEVYAALKDVATAQAHWDEPAAAATEARADQLGTAIQRIFWDRRAQRFHPSMQKSPPAFYPDIVAQVYPWLADMSGPGQYPRQAWQQWKQRFGAGWIARKYDSSPWGLVALAAEKLGDTASAACWSSQSDALRGGSSWNLLEEAVWQSLQAQLTQGQRLDPVACAAFQR
jgi:hypothetical protein